jgi:hypothetical protein
MATNPGKNVEPRKTTHPDFGITCDFDQINSPGCYVLNHTGTLLRIPEDALIPGRSPAIDTVSHQKWIVTKIAEDPYIPLTQARMSAADMDLYVNF